MAVLKTRRGPHAARAPPRRVLLLLALSCFVLWRTAGLLASRSRGAAERGVQASGGSGSGDGSSGGGTAEAEAAACLPQPELDRLRRNFELWAKVHTHLDPAVIQRRQALLATVGACSGDAAAAAAAAAAANRDPSSSGGGGEAEGPAGRSTGLVRLSTQLLSLPGWTEAASRCACGCTVHGTCHEELGRCDCPLGYSGPACERHSGPLSEDDCKRYGWWLPRCDARDDSRGRCLNACNGRGECYGAFCHCYPGYFGHDCSLSLGAGGRGGAVLLDGQGYQENSAGPLVYVYELPPHVSTWFPWWIDRFEGLLLSERLLAGGHRTADPARAQWYWVPAALRSLWRDEDGRALAGALSQGWPMWNATGGSRHILLDSGDWPVCERPPWFLAFFANATFLAHWGSYKKRDIRFPTGCFRPDLDIVLPPENVFMGTEDLEANPWYPGNVPPARNLTFLFGGGICAWRESDGPPPCKDKQYSFGVRERVWAAHKDRPGYLVASHVPGYHRLSTTAKFCLAPAGAGWGRRAASAPWFGCIPVVIQDDILQPFEPFLDWSAFALRLPEAQVEEMHVALAAAEGPRLQQLQANLACAARHLYWAGTWGGIFAGDGGEYDAFNTLLAILRAKLRHPGVPAAQLRSQDAQLALFMACKSPLRSSHSAPLCLRPHCRFEAAKQPWPYGRQVPPGGAVCQGAGNLAACRRFMWGDQ